MKCLSCSETLQLFVYTGIIIAKSHLLQSERGLAEPLARSEDDIDNMLVS